MLERFLTAHWEASMSIPLFPTRARPRAAHLAVPLAILSLGAVTAPAAHAAWPGVNGRISLTQRVPAEGGVRANRDVFAYALDGSRTRVTTTTDNEEQSSWSPDGRWVAYKRRNAVYVAPWDGSVPPRALTTPNDGTINNTQPAWSPDARSILFRTNRSDPSANVADVWIMDSPFGPAPGEPSARPLIVRPGDERYPTFSPDGERLLFRGDDDGIAPSGDEEIYVANADGSGVVALTDDDALDSAPAWSPDGTQIAWESTRDGTDREIYVMNADGTNVRQLTDNLLHDEGPAWSPDGRLITFTRSDTEAVPGDVWVMHGDGSEARALTSTPVIEESPDWQPLPITAPAASEDRTACGDLSLLPGGVASVVALKAQCHVALKVASRWQDGARVAAPPRRIRGFRCEDAPHSFDQVLVQCLHRGRRKAVAFVYREPPAGA
jgi:WD40-like Beta Propeller Repeat